MRTEGWTQTGIVRERTRVYTKEYGKSITQKTTNTSVTVTFIKTIREL